MTMNCLPCSAQYLFPSAIDCFCASMLPPQAVPALACTLYVSGPSGITPVEHPAQTVQSRIAADRKTYLRTLVPPEVISDDSLPQVDSDIINVVGDATAASIAGASRTSTRCRHASIYSVACQVYGRCRRLGLRARANLLF